LWFLFEKTLTFRAKKNGRALILDDIKLINRVETQGVVMRHCPTRCLGDAKKRRRPESTVDFWWTCRFVAYSEGQHSDSKKAGLGLDNLDTTTGHSGGVIVVLPVVELG
jgi:hypothetical protein